MAGLDLCFFAPVGHPESATFRGLALTANLRRRPLLLLATSYAMGYILVVPGLSRDSTMRLRDARKYDNLVSENLPR